MVTRLFFHLLISSLLLLLSRNCEIGAVLVFKECKQKIHGSDPFKVKFFFCFGNYYCPAKKNASWNEQVDCWKYPKISSRWPGHINGRDKAGI